MNPNRSLRPSRLLAAALVAGLGATACNFASTMQAVGNATGVQMPNNAEEKTLMPSQVHRSFAPLDAQNPFAQGNAQVQYLETGLPNYDQFFLESTRAHGTLVLARDTLRMTNETLNSGIVDQALSGDLLMQAVGSEVELTQQQRNQVFVSLLAGNYDAARRVVPALSDRGADNIRANLLDSHPNLRNLQEFLPASVEGLTSLPTLVTNLVSSGQNLVNSAQTDFAGPNAVLLPRILTELRSTTSLLSDLPSLSAEVLSEFRQVIPGL